MWDPTTAALVTVLRPGHDGAGVFVAPGRNDHVLVSIGGSSMKIWAPPEWWCVASTDVTIGTAMSSQPQGLPPGDDVYLDTPRYARVTTSAGPTRTHVHPTAVNAL